MPLDAGARLKPAQAGFADRSLTIRSSDRLCKETGQ